MSSDRFLLWGIDGQLTGSEQLLQVRLPLFTRAGEPDVVYIARRVDWSPELPDSDVERVPAARAEEYGDRLDVDEMSISSGQLVFVIGPKLRESLSSIDLQFEGTTSGGFGVARLDAGAADLAANVLEEYARRRFDRELACGYATEQARHALVVMRSVGVGDLRSHLIRTLAMHWLDRDVDRYRRVLRLAHVRLRDKTDLLEREVQAHIQLTRTMNGYQSWCGIESHGMELPNVMNVANIRTDAPSHGDVLPSTQIGKNPGYILKDAFPTTFHPVIGKKFVNPKLFFPDVLQTDDDDLKMRFFREDV